MVYKMYIKKNVKTQNTGILQHFIFTALNNVRIGSFKQVVIRKQA